MTVVNDKVERKVEKMNTYGNLTLNGKSTSMSSCYICANCGMWVSNGSGHCCTDRTTDRTVEIIELLKQIISRLDGARYERK